jgi:hypothetical protein
MILIMKRFTMLLIATLAMLFYSCGPSVEGEEKDWKKNQTAIEKLKKDFPAYATMINEKWEAAKGMKAAAENISVEEDKAKKMAAANNLLDRGCLGNLRDMKSKITSLESKKSAAKKKRKKAEKGKSAAADAIDDAKDALKYAGKVLAFSTSDLGQDPCAKVNEAFKLLKNAQSDLDDAMKKMNEKKETKTDKSTSKTDTKKVAKVKCTYCSAKNDASNEKCSSCGADL